MRVLSRIVYKVPVDYDRSIKKGVIAGKYDNLLINEISLTDKNYPSRRLGIVERNIELVQFDFGPKKETGQLESGAAIDMMACALEEISLVPAIFHEILSLGETFPSLQRKFRILAMGSRVSDFHSDYCQFIGKAWPQKRVCGAYDTYYGYKTSWRFAGIAKTD